MFKFILSRFKCNLIKSHVCDIKSNNKQLHHLSILYKNCIKIYINDVLVPKQSSYLVYTHEQNNYIKIKLVGILNSQTHLLKVNARPIDVNFPFFKTRNTITAIKFIHRLSHKKFNLSSLIKQKKIGLPKKIERVHTVNLSKNVKLDTEIIGQKYKLTNITNNYEQANLSNT